MGINYLFNTLTQWLTARFVAIATALAIAVGGWIIAKVLSSITAKAAKKIKLNAAVQELIIPAIYWGTLLLTALIVGGVVMTGVFYMDILWFNAAALAILKALLIFSVGCAAIGLVTNVLKKVLSVSKIDVTLHPFLCSSAKVLMFLVLTVGCIEILGIPTASMVAAMASVGLALSLSVKDHLSNLIGGVVVLLTKPFTKGDYIEFDGVTGVVSEIGLIYTILKTYDNKKIYIPNNDAAKAKITNHTTESDRRLELVFSIGYHDDYDKACRLILKEAAATGLVLDSPAPVVRMLEHGASAIRITCRLWVTWDNFFELGCLMRERVKASFDQNGITIPYEQVELHIVEKKESH